MAVPSPSATLLLQLLLQLLLCAPPAAAYLDLVSNNPLVCLAGYGQRGKLRSAGVEWVRTCKHSKFCWEATTTDIESMKQLFDFPWDDYYEEYYLQGCSGDYGTERLWSPFIYTNQGVHLQSTPEEVLVNITLPDTITGRGGTVQMELKYSCFENFCSSAPSSSSPPWRSALLTASVGAALLLAF
mmetsp:Transcript_7498/g.12597  ORF Transcript_7498/g.12597 Transcript_7498/m.12597 type:complete len:185 (+) Transcript_7498:192-746(+)|eukprot:CAMPEP_0114426548 /NCGR_PEP_ID=MMETSP0103-20121206/7862_1 /TAXON_ID=37642 ORGANISM="Paraphysomonas imperforata, Strain PA2" /NCGR_SAMPLE_ID=MMETSP0103 /ASSEMBLY_ACC=CAM_ASM_000201 /LENGTH=184 /DNA_ID=CAMNT_0001595527 /DNA_START=205 /DNA_END=759 /DNA_ORIENTATION=+